MIQNIDRYFLLRQMETKLSLLAFFSSLPSLHDLSTLLKIMR